MIFAALLAAVCAFLLWNAGSDFGSLELLPADRNGVAAKATKQTGRGGDPAGAAVRVVLSKLEVTVTDDRFGSPIVEARVLCRVRGRESAEALPCSQLQVGRYAVESLQSGTEYEIRAEAEGYLGKRVFHKAVEGGSRIGVRLVGALGVEGQVRSAASKEGLAQVEVVVEGRRGNAITRTDARGCFSVNGLTQGAYEIVAKKQGFADAVESFSLVESLRQDLELQPQSMVDLTIHAGAESGGVTLLYVIVHVGGAVEWEGFTPFKEGIGRSRLPIPASVAAIDVTVHLPTGQNVTVSAPVVEFRGLRLATAKLPTKWVRFRLQTRGGQLSNTTAQFQAGAESHSLTTDDLGACQLPLDGLKGSRIVFWTSELLSPPTAVRATSEEIVVQLQVPEHGVFVRGVEKVDCAPADVSIRSAGGVRGFPKSSSEAGVRFAVPDGSYLVTARGMVVHASPIPCIDGKGELDLGTVPFGVIEGFGFNVPALRLWKRERSGWVAGYEVVVQSDGTFRLPHVFPGEYILGASAEYLMSRFVIRGSDKVNLDGRGLQSVDRVLRVVDGRGFPVGDAKVVVQSEVGARSVRLKTDHDGRVVIRTRKGRKTLRIEVNEETFVVDPAAASELRVAGANGRSFRLGTRVGLVRRLLVVREQSGSYSISRSRRRGSKYWVHDGAILVLAHTLAGYQPLEIDGASGTLRMPNEETVVLPADVDVYVASTGGVDLLPERWSVPVVSRNRELVVCIPRSVIAIAESKDRTWRKRIK